MSIGEVLGHLRAEFPDATISKLRFLEAEGLVEPRRTPAGYRKYTWSDVARLRVVLTLQRDHYLPLRVIREHLAAMDADGRTDGADGRAENDAGDSPGGAGWPRAMLAAVEPVRDPVDDRTGAGAGVDPADRRPGRADVLTHADPPGRADLLTRADLLSRAGVDEPTLAALEQHGLVRARPGGRYDGDALVVVRVAAELERFGVEPRHLRASRAAADREVGLYAQLVTPLARQADPAARARAAEAVRELITLSQRLHGALIRAGLRETLGQ
jgi:DNA-binding transcriptional MerR regulator